MTTAAKTRATKMCRFMTLKSKSIETQVQKICFGENGNIRTRDLSGIIITAEMPETLTIDGCDWRGALSIWYHLHPYHATICKNGDFYFSIPPECLDQDISGFYLGNEIVSTIFFHHLYNLLLLKEPNTPSFCSSIKQKYEYLQEILQSNVLTVFGETVESLNTVLHKIQCALKIYVYKNWDEIRIQFLTPWSRHVKQNDKLKFLDFAFENPEQILRYIESPLENNEVPPEIVVKHDCAITNYVCKMLNEKIDLQANYIKTGVKPLLPNWVKDLDFFFFRLRRDGI